MPNTVKCTDQQASANQYPQQIIEIPDATLVADLRETLAHMFMRNVPD